MTEEEAGLVSIISGKPLPRKEHQIQLATEAVAVALGCVWRGQTLTLAPVIHQESEAYHAQPPSNLCWSTSLMLMTYFSLISSKESLNIPRYATETENVQVQCCKTVSKRVAMKKIYLNGINTEG